MPAERVSMRRVREILRLKHACGATDRAIARSLGVARSTVALTFERVAAAGLTWPLPEGLSERVLEAMLYAGAGAKQGLRRKAEPDWTHVHRELRRPGVTLMLLWEEYRAAEPGGYGYNRWCELYRAWEGRLSPPMRQSHPAGERLFVDYAGQTVEIVDGRTGEVREAQVFVATLGGPDQEPGSASGSGSENAASTGSATARLATAGAARSSAAIGMRFIVTSWRAPAGCGRPEPSSPFPHPAIDAARHLRLQARPRRPATPAGCGCGRAAGASRAPPAPAAEGPAKGETASPPRRGWPGGRGWRHRG